jgi:DNA-binding NarL/FixJ family response regulator
MLDYLITTPARRLRSSSLERSVQSHSLERSVYMATCASLRRRALIVEDEFVIALDLEHAMSALGFEVCGLAPSDRAARSLAMSKDPDIVLMDVCLEGGQEGIETARWLQEVCGASVVFVTVCSDENTLERIHQQVPGAPILSKLSFREHLAAAVAEASKPTTRPT